MRLVGSFRSPGGRREPQIDAVTTSGHQSACSGLVSASLVALNAAFLSP
jgi:hypothetical protein